MRKTSKQNEKHNTCNILAPNIHFITNACEKMRKHGIDFVEPKAGDSYPYRNNRKLNRMIWELYKVSKILSKHKKGRYH